MNLPERDVTLAECLVAEARTWLGTPYRHQASVKGMGCDCLGLLRGVWRNVLGFEPVSVPAYTTDWGSAEASETILEGARRILDPVMTGVPRAGDVIVFRWRANAVARHMGLASGPSSFIHAWEKAGVVEAALVPQWRNRIAGLFSVRESSPDFR
ncbi:MAG: NlpC/P60 family protein [Rhizobiaceae bacterium]